ncbi:MAG: hypothetical protein LBP59_01215 [Planctomycetaceae bacterium]|nr:hypothetical protein [Planctomycetaceae bacterium]
MAVESTACRRDARDPAFIVTINLLPTRYRLKLYTSILLVLEIQRFKSVKACRPKSRQSKGHENSSTNSLKFRERLLKFKLISESDYRKQNLRSNNPS